MVFSPLLSIIDGDSLKSALIALGALPLLQLGQEQRWEGVKRVGEVRTLLAQPLSTVGANFLTIPRFIFGIIFTGTY